MKLILHIFLSLVAFISLFINSFIVAEIIYHITKLPIDLTIISIILVLLSGFITILYFLKLRKNSKLGASKKFIIFSSLFFIIILIIGFVLTVLNTATVTVDKPAVYLYPEEDMEISVTLDIDGRITKDVPEYGDGWDVFVEKNGLIEGRYDYLFYENTLNQVELPEEGWIVAQEDLYTWFDDVLPKLGLNEKETIQFKEYWLYELLDSPYYEIKLFSNEFLLENMKLSINPTPDSILRLIFNFKEIREFKNIKNPIMEEFEREGFTVVEWGGRLEK